MFEKLLIGSLLVLPLMVIQADASVLCHNLKKQLSREGASGA